MFERTKSLTGKLEQASIIKTKVAATGEASVASVIHNKWLAPPSAQTKRNNYRWQVILHLEEDTCCLGMRMCGTGLWGNQIILMTDFCPGISKATFEMVYDDIDPLVSALIQSHDLFMCSGKVTNVFCCALRNLFHLSREHAFLCTAWYFHHVFFNAILQNSHEIYGWKISYWPISVWIQ